MSDDEDQIMSTPRKQIDLGKFKMTPSDSPVTATPMSNRSFNTPMSRKITNSAAKVSFKIIRPTSSRKRMKLDIHGWLIQRMKMEMP